MDTKKITNQSELKHQCESMTRQLQMVEAYLTKGSVGREKVRLPQGAIRKIKQIRKLLPDFLKQDDDVASNEYSLTCDAIVQHLMFFDLLEWLLARMDGLDVAKDALIKHCIVILAEISHLVMAHFLALSVEENNDYLCELLLEDGYVDLKLKEKLTKLWQLRCALQVDSLNLAYARQRSKESDCQMAHATLNGLLKRLHKIEQQPRL